MNIEPFISDCIASLSPQPSHSSEALQGEKDEGGLKAGREGKSDERVRERVGRAERGSAKAKNLRANFA